MRDALELVKNELGPDAVILGTRSLPATGLGALARRKRVEIMAAPPSLPTPASRLNPRAASMSRLAAAIAPPPGKSQFPQHLYPYYVQLVQNEVAEELAAQLVQQAAARVPPGSAGKAALRTALREYIARLIPDTGGLSLRGGTPRRVALVGPPGGGKTTTLAKLAADFKLRQGKRVALLSLDMNRLGAHEQLRRYAEVIDVPLHTAQTSAEVRPGLGRLPPFDLLLIDTPGLGLREQGHFARLATLLRAAQPDETLLVLPASLAPAVQVRVAQAFAGLGISRVVLTRLDEAVGLGVVLNVTQRLNLGVSYLTTGQNVPADIEEACGRRLAELLLGADDEGAGAAVIIR